MQNNSLIEVHFFNIDMLRKKISSQFKGYLYQRLYCKTYFILNIFCQDECKTGHEETFIKILNKWRNNCLWRNTIHVALHISPKSIKGIVSRNVNLKDTAPLIRVIPFYENPLGYHCQQCRVSAFGCLVSYFICMNMAIIIYQCFFCYCFWKHSIRS